jgi:hypothetical protein
VTDFKAPIAVGQFDTTTTSVFMQDVVATVLDITVHAWPHLLASGRVCVEDHEDAITDRLRWELDAEKRRRSPEPQLRFERETQSDSPDEEHPTGLIDVYVIYSFEQSEYFAMECKKIDDHRKTPAKKYVENGVCRFVAGKYSFGHACGAMVGYVTEGSPAVAAEYLGRTLTDFDQERTGMERDWGWRPETRFGPIPDLYSSRHVQTGTAAPILLLHLFLGFPGE